MNFDSWASFCRFSKTLQILQRTVCMRALPNLASSVNDVLTTDMAEAIRVIFSGKQCLTNEQCWQGCGKVLAEWNTFVSLRSGEKSVRDREMTSSQPQGALPLLALRQIDHMGKGWLILPVRWRGFHLWWLLLQNHERYESIHKCLGNWNLFENRHILKKINFNRQKYCQQGCLSTTKLQPATLGERKMMF